MQSIASYLSTLHHARVVLFNARGVESRGSWTGASESQDYQEILQFAGAQFAQDWPDAEDTILLVGVRSGALMGDDASPC